ncbi:ankyrin repeat domain-containing protein 55-like [Amphiura filiformis]|uniref:ankyrin repeat domain-containing protein 55-like n=1 Tax=Amphiura filiformis TaxID=82378 RepID=UPI003B225ABB
MEQSPNGRPQQLTVNSINTSTIRVTWIPATDSEVYPVTGFRIVCECLRTDNQWHHVKEECVDADCWSASISGLQENTLYRFLVYAKNRFGEGPESEPSRSRTTEVMTGKKLHDAVKLGDLEAVKNILENSPELKDVPDGSEGFSPLMAAAQSGNMTMVEFLLSYGADVHACNSAGKYSLMVACNEGHREVAMKLRSNGARWERRDKSGCTAMHWAVDGGNTELIKWMIEDGALVDEHDSGCSWTPLMRCAASEDGKTEVAKVLL